MRTLKKIFKVIGIVLGVLVMIIAVVYTKAYVAIQNRLTKTYDVKIQPLDIQADSALVARGQHLAEIKACTECHGADLSGKPLVEDFPLGHIYASNLTKGEGGRPQDWGTADWTRALKHGLRRGNTPLIFMPSHEFTQLSAEDMGALIAYLQQVPNVDHVLPENKIGPLARVLADYDKLPLFPAEMIDHSKDLVTDVKAEVSATYGKYLSTSCVGCHRTNLKGGEPIAPGFPVVADISSTGNPGKWSDEQFIQTLRTGVTPEGKVLKPEEMPWTMTKSFSEVELKALHLYLKSM